MKSIARGLADDKQSINSSCHLVLLLLLFIIIIIATTENIIVLFHHSVVNRPKEVIPHPPLSHAETVSQHKGSLTPSGMSSPGGHAPVVFHLSH